jgi:hypothetical protein
MDPVKKGAVLCSHCSLIAHSKCAGRAPPTCDLRSRLLMHAQFAEHGSSPTDIFTRLPPPVLAPATTSDGLGASSSRGSLDRERTGSPQLQQHSPLATTSPSSPTHTPVAYKVLSPFKRSRASLSPDPTHSNSSISLAGVTPPPQQKQQQQQQPMKSLLSEGNVIRRKLSIILTGQREPPPRLLQPQQQQQQQRQRPLSIASISSSVSPQDSSQQSNSLRSLQTAAESISSRAARIDASVVSAARTVSSSNTGPASPPPHPAPNISPADEPRRASVYSGYGDVAATSKAQAPGATASVVSQNNNTAQRTRRGRGHHQSNTSKTSSNGNCAIQ